MKTTPNTIHLLRRALKPLAGSIAALLLSGPVFAGSAQWLPAPGTGDWNTAGNWTPATVPNAPADVATFFTSATTAISISASTEVNGIVFNLGASAFTITDTDLNKPLTLSGAGITNNSGIVQNFVAKGAAVGNHGLLNFKNSATAGINTTFTAGSATSLFAFGGIVDFFDTSSAGSGTFITQGATVSGNGNGFTQFFDNSTAANGTFTTTGGSASGAQGGFTIFFANSTAASGTFTTNGGTASGANGGVTEFLGDSTAGSATFTTNGGTVSGVTSSGVTEFFANSTAGSGTFLNTGGTVSGGFGGLMRFNDDSKAGNGTFTNEGGTVSGAFGGYLRFFDNSTAAAGNFTNNSGGAIGASAGLTSFFETSTAGSATFVNRGGTFSGSGGGSTGFFDTATAGLGTFITHGGTVSGALGGFTDFNNSSTADQGTFINNGGTVAGASGGTTRFFSTSLAENATLIANGGTNGGLGGTILFFGDSTGGTAAVRAFGNGHLDISGHNAPGVTIGSLEGDGDVFLGARNLTVGSNNRSTTFSGVIQDGGSGGGTGGSLTKIGTGTLILTGSNSYSGGTRIEFGTLAVGSDHALGKGDVMLNVGILRTSNGPRDINVEKNYVQFGAAVNGGYTGGTLRLGIGGPGKGKSDRLVVAGTATLAGTLDLVRLDGYKPKRGDKVQLVTAGGGVIGKFVEVENPFEKTGTLLRTKIVYQPNEVDLKAVQGSFAHDLGGLTPNQKSVARQLDRAAGAGEANKLIDFLDTEPLGALPHDLEKIAPEELTSIFNLGVSLTNVQSANLERRMSDVQAGSTGFSASGYTVSGSGPSYSGDAGYRGPAGKGGKELREPDDARLGVFVTGVGEFTNIGNTSNARGFDLTTGGFTLGVDYKITPNFALGITAGYARTGADLTGNGRLNVDGTRAGLYATYFTGTGFYADAAVTGGYNSYSSRRSALKGTARGDTNGGELNALLATGYDWKTGGLTVGPTASVQYTNMGLTSFREHGSLAPLRFKDQFAESLRTALGLKLSYDIQAGGVVIRPEARAAWQHEFENSAFAIDSRLANGAGKNFTVAGPAIGDDSLLVGAGVAVLWNERTSTYVYYDGELARSNYSSNNVSGGVRLSF